MFCMVSLLRKAKQFARSEGLRELFMWPIREFYPLWGAIIMSGLAAFTGIVRQEWWPYVLLGTIAIFVAVVFALGYLRHGKPNRKGQVLVGVFFLALAAVLLLGALASARKGYELVWGNQSSIALPAERKGSSISLDKLRERYPDREITTETPRELLEQAKGLTVAQYVKRIEPYIGVWVPSTGQVVAVLGDNQHGHSVNLQSEQASIECFFSPGSEKRLLRVNEGAEISVLGRIRRTQTKERLYLKDCEILE